MMALVNLIVLGVLFAAATGGVWLLWAIVALLFARRRKRAVLLGLPASIAIVAAACAGLWFYETRPAKVFEREFGFPPPTDVVFLNSSTFALGDSGSTYLHFRVSSTTVTRMVASTGLTPGAISFSTNTRPAWFRPTGAACWSRSTDFSAQASTPANAAFASETRIIIYDEGTGDAWYEFSGVD